MNMLMVLAVCYLTIGDLVHPWSTGDKQDRLREVPDEKETMIVPNAHLPATSNNGIVKSRANLKNFQLIIITHDEDFVDSLGKSAYAEKCYRVSKTHNGLSKIDVCNITSFGAH
ncbi:unnamed protein product [Rotaria sordida]|uniref:Uncharacterized protein n=1 Tax=Rotaria sordida TaxID=392033 RepID=A0A816CXA6_9BILA|nr:unnamed protein product [Rotaria sordida]